MIDQDWVDRHTPSPEIAAKIEAQRGRRLEAQHRAVLRVSAPEGVVDQARRYMGLCARGDGLINFGDLYVRRRDDLYHAGCDPA